MERTFKKKVISISIKQSLYAQLIYFGFIPDKKRIYFPKFFVPWDKFFKDKRGINLSFADYDIKELLKKDVFTETEKTLIELYLEGFDYIEIAKKLGYTARHVHKTFQKLENRFKNEKETFYKPKIKWGRIGAYKKKYK